MIFSWIDRSFLKEYFLKPLCFAAVIIIVLFLLNKFSYFNFSLGSNSSFNSFEVIGEGKVSATPNIATTTYTINETGSTEEAARSAANTKQNQALAAIKKVGIAEKDIKTIGFYVNQNYEPLPLNTDAVSNQAEPLIYPPSRPQPQNGYVATVTTEIKSSDLKKINQAIDAVTTIGATVGGVSYTFDNEEKYQAEATDKAIADAKMQAENMAKAAGFKLGKIVTIRNANTDQYGYPQPYSADTSLKAGSPETQTELQPGQNEITARMGITYYIKD